MRQLRRSPPLYGQSAFVLSGILWIVIRFLIAYQPPPLSYDSYNRLFALPLLLLIVGMVSVIWPQLRHWPTPVRNGWRAALAGMVIMFFGNAVEFWGVLLQDKPNANAAARTGEDAWVGSDIGWIVFGFGHLLVVIGMVLVGSTAVRTRLFGRWSALPLVIAILGLLWPFLSFTPVGDFAVMAATGAAWGLLGYPLLSEWNISRVGTSC